MIAAAAPVAPAATVAATADDENGDSDVEVVGEEEDEFVEHLGSDDALEEVPERSHQRRARSYKIQEVIRRRQVMLVQVVKKSAATRERRSPPICPSPAAIRC